MSEKPRALMLLGPTACGKTAVSLMLARDFDAEIISVDSALIYRGMDIGTAKPTKEEQGGVPHHLIDILDIEESYSAAAFAEDAERLIGEISGRSRYPLLVGGTALAYIFISAWKAGLATAGKEDAVWTPSAGLERLGFWASALLGLWIVGYFIVGFAVVLQ